MRRKREITMEIINLKVKMGKSKKKYFVMRDVYLRQEFFTENYSHEEIC